MNGNNVMEGDANNKSNVCTSCTNDDNENKYGHVLMSIGYYCMQQYSQIRDGIGGSGGHTLMIRDQHPPPLHYFHSHHHPPLTPAVLCVYKHLASFVRSLLHR